MMSPVKSRAGGRTAGMRPVSRNPSHFRSCRRLLIAQGTLLVALGSAGFIADAIHPNASPVGAHVLMLTMTPWHSALLVGFGVLAVDRGAQPPRGHRRHRHRCRRLPGAGDSWGGVGHPPGAGSAGTATTRHPAVRSAVRAQLRRPVLAAARRARRARLGPSPRHSPTRSREDPARRGDGR